MQYKKTNGEIATVKVISAENNDISPDKRNEKTENLLNIHYIDDVAVLSIKTFDSTELNNTKENFPRFISSSFEEIDERSIQKLVIDLRGNGGGSDLYGSLLYSYLANRKFRYYKRLMVATKNLPYDKLTRASSSFNNLDTSLLLKMRNGHFRLAKSAHPNLRIIRPAPQHYKGKVWFLIDGLSFSTTAEFCAIAKSKARGLFIGEETGGTYYGNTSGVQIDTVLPYTNIHISFGTVEYEMHVQKATYKNRGIIPEYLISPSIEDIIFERDIVLESALKIANKN